MSILFIKRGDTLALNGNFKQNNGEPLNLTPFTIKCNIIDEKDKVIAVISESDTNNRSLIVDKPLGTFQLVMKDTNILIDENYWADFSYTTVDGIEQSSKSIKLKVKSKLV